VKLIKTTWKTLCYTAAYTYKDEIRNFIDEVDGERDEVERQSCIKESTNIHN